MAARENQGYLIAVIILVLLSLVLALAAFLGLSKMNEYADNKAAAEQSLNLERKLSQAREIKAEVLKSMVGEMGGGSVTEIQIQIESLDRLAGSSDIDAAGQEQIRAIISDVDAIKTVYDKVMLANSGVAAGDQAQELTYKTLIDNLSTVLAKKHGEYNIKDRQATLAEQEAASSILQMQTEVDQVKAMLATREEDLQNEKQAAAAKQTELTASLDENLQQLQDANAKLEQLKLETAGKIDELQNSIAKVEGENVNLKNKINVYERETFDKPDGRVVQVAAALQTVYLDLGRVDGLTENRSFAIYDQSVTNFEKDQHKATVEVTRVMDHQSEARVTSEDPQDPIVSGDYVLTATWDPGYAVPMALAGKFDLDQDGFSDLDKLIQMIKRNGGDVVAWHDEDGNIQGEIDSRVRYLVLGDSDQIGPFSNPNIAKAMKAMQDQADENTVQVIDLQKLLNRMGVRGKPKVENLSRQSSSEFQSRSPNSLKASDR